MPGKKAFNVRLLRIDDIVITNASIENNTDLISLDKNKYVYFLKYNFELSVNIKFKKLRIVFFCELDTEEKETNKKIGITGRFEISFFFIIDNLDEIIGEGPEFEVNQDIGVTISNIAYSTARGIIFTRCQGTILKHFLLPVLPTDEIIAMQNSSKKPHETI